MYLLHGCASSCWSRILCWLRLGQHWCMHAVHHLSWSFNAASISPTGRMAWKWLRRCRQEQAALHMLHVTAKATLPLCCCVIFLVSRARSPSVGPDAFLVCCVQVYLRNDMIIRAGELGREMFFIKAGAVQVPKLLIPYPACPNSTGDVAATKTGNGNAAACAIPHLGLSICLVPGHAQTRCYACAQAYNIMLIVCYKTIRNRLVTLH